MAAPEAGMAAPGAGMAAPKAGMAAPKADMAAPEAGTAAPGAHTAMATPPGEDGITMPGDIEFRIGVTPHLQEGVATVHDVVYTNASGQGGGLNVVESPAMARSRDDDGRRSPDRSRHRHRRRQHIKGEGSTRRGGGRSRADSRSRSSHRRSRRREDKRVSLASMDSEIEATAEIGRSVDRSDGLELMVCFVCVCWLVRWCVWCCIRMARPEHKVRGSAARIAAAARPGQELPGALTGADKAHGRYDAEWFGGCFVGLDVLVQLVGSSAC